jgi:tRNA wybutosine-synthesizing protein 1
MEMTPALIWCTHKCQFCWRPLEYTVCGEPEADDPEEIIDGCIRARHSLLTGFKGNPNVEKNMWEEAIKPTNAAISLAGEPTLYPKISEIIEEFQKRGITTFLVTNGTRPDRLQTLDTEPTTLYISLCAPDRKTYLQVNKPLINKGWKRINESLKLMKSFNCRKVLRLTLANGLNLKHPEKYAKLILKAEPDYIETKGFMHVGEAQDRLPRAAMPTFEEIREFTQRLSTHTNYKLKDYSTQSCVILLTKN